MRVTRSFTFLDLCGFTRFTSEEGDDRATAVLGDFRGCVRTICSRRGVRVAKWLGDGAMIVAVDAPPMVAAVLEIEAKVDESGSPLPIRGGLATGAVILFEGDDYIGSPVNLAARLCDAAGPRQILAVPELIPAVPAWGGAGEPHRLPIAGFAQPVEVVRVSRRVPGPDAVIDPVCGLSIPLDAALEREIDGGRIWFCSDSCAAAWADRTAAPAEPTLG